MRKTDRKPDASGFRAARAARKTLAAVLAACMLLGLLPGLAFAQEPAHDHTGWTAVTMDTEDTSKINVGGAKQEFNTLTDGSYYLDADLTVSLTVEGPVDLCLNGHSVTVSNAHAVTVSSGAHLTLWDCAAGSTGKIAYTGTSSSYYGIYNQGTLTLHSGAVEGTYRGVYNYSNSTFTMSGGSVTGGSGTSGYGVYNNSSSIFKLSGGSVSGGQYGIYNYYSSSQVYLSGSPTVTGTTAGIYTASSSSKIYADDGADTPTPYSGDEISLRYSSGSNGNTIVYHVTEDTKGKFTLVGSIGDNFELKFSEEDNALQFQGKPQTLTWYGIDGEELTGDGYPSTWPYGSYFPDDDSGLPAAPAVEGKLFLGWLYKKGDASDWSTEYWSDSPIRSAALFKADYIDSFTGGGSGTADDPYQLATAADLQKLSTLVSKGIAAYNNSHVWYRLTADIDLSTVCGEELGSWTPIGYGVRSSYTFRANLDGNSKTISNLYINTSSSGQGLFGGLEGATVKNLTLTGSVAAVSDYGALAGDIYNGSTAENVDVTGVTLTPYGYTPDGNRIMAYKVDDDGSNTIHIQGNYKNNWIQTTYNREGYSVATADLTGGTVKSSAEFINGGKYVQLSYTVTAGETAIEGGKLAVHADVQIGDNDGAAVEVIQNAAGQVIGLKMVDTHTGCPSQDAQFNLYFDGTGGVTPVDTYWFGFYADRTNMNSTYGYIYFAPLNDDTKSSERTYEQDASGVYTKLTGTDSGFAVSWQNINLEAGQSKTYSFILGVGEKADPPQWGSGNAVTLTLAADVEQDRRLVNVSAKVKDAAGLTDTLYYSVDGGEGEVLGSVAADGSMKSITGQLDLSDYAEGSYTFSFWVVNSKGAASASVERTITITADGIEGLDSGDEPSHTHNWATAWSHDATHHWHECTAEGCDVTSDSGKDSYGAHVYDNDADTTCNTCGYVRTVSPTYSISGTVTNHEGDGVEGATVKLMKGRDMIQETTTNENGVYTFTGVDPGSYNVVATKDGKTMTILVTVIDADLPNRDLSMPGENVNSVLDVKETPVPEGAAADVTRAVVGGLEAVAASHTEVDKTVTVTMTVEVRDEANASNDEKTEIAQIKAVATVKTLEYLDIKVEKQIDNNTPEAITDTGDTVIEIEVPFNFSGKVTDSVTVYRYHGTSAEALDKNDTKDGGTFRLDTANGLIHIYATKFSTYAIGYTSEGGGTPVTPPEPTTPPTTPPVYTGGGDSGPTTYPVSTSDSTSNGAVKLSHRNASRGTTVTITVTPDQGYELSKVTVTDRDGKEIAVTSKGNGIYTFIMPSAKVTVNTVFTKIADGYKNCPKDDTCPIWPYTDTSAEAWYHDGIHYCIERGLMSGYGGYTFGPNADASRAMIASILWRLEGRPVVNYILPFDDVAEGAWYTEAIRWAASQGIVSGYGNRKFGPGDPITREQLAAMLYRYEQYKGGGFTGTWMFQLDHADADRVSSWAYESICWTTMNGIVRGIGNGLLDPGGKATRAQAAAMIMRYCEKA